MVSRGLIGPAWVVYFVAAQSLCASLLTLLSDEKITVVFGALSRVDSLTICGGTFWSS